MKKLSNSVTASECGARIRGVGTTGILALILALALVTGCVTDGMSKSLSKNGSKNGSKTNRANIVTKSVSASDSAVRPFTLRYYGGPHGLAWQVRN